MVQLRGRVGRHANTGRHCQNWKDDQEVVIGLLNGIPAADGGAWHTLNGRVIAGIASERLYRAILVFEKKHFRHQSGFVDPNGPMFPLLLKLGTRSYLPPAAPAPPPAKTVWDVTTSSIMQGLHKGLDGDNSLSHADVVEIIRSALSDGSISAEELADLSTVTTNSKSMSPRSRKMLNMFITEIKGTANSNGPYSLASPKAERAADQICNFLKRSSGSYFPRFDRDEVGVGLLMRIANPGLLRQGQAGICGPAAFLFNVAMDNPDRYTAFAIDLYEKGQGNIDKLAVKPGDDVRNYLPPSDADIAQVDWMTMASLRDSANWFFDYSSFKDNDGGTQPSEVEAWLEAAGYSDVRNETNKFISKGADNADEASQLFSKGYSVCLFIHSNMLYADRQTNSSSRLSHVVVLRSLIDRSDGNVRLNVFTWGEGYRKIPQGGDLSLADFLENYYGYVAGKP